MGKVRTAKRSIFLAWLLATTWGGGMSAEALPVKAAQNDPAIAYLQHKYRLYLGDDRGACGYLIDPTDVYGDTQDRWLTALRSRGETGSACAGVVEFQILRVNCPTQTLSKLVLEGETLRDRGWMSYPLNLYRFQAGELQTVSRIAAEKICSLSTRSVLP